jgi:hypothetical protein
MRVEADETQAVLGRRLRLRKTRRDWLLKLDQREWGPFESRYLALMEVAVWLYDRGERQLSVLLAELADEDRRRLR